MSKIQPLVGITGGLGAEWSKTGVSHSSYAASVGKAGARTVPLGHGRHGRFDECDGLCVTGGCDIHPKYMKPLPGDESLTPDEIIDKYNIKTERMRDEVELRFVREAIAQGKPVLGVCRGFQVLNVAVGGYLIGDISKWIPKALVHTSHEGVSASHEIKIEPNTVIGRSYGATRIVTNSRHHQGLTSEFVSCRFKITAMASDGVVEAVEMKDAPFVVGVQWHPEKQADEYINSISGPLFEAFVEACAAYRRSR